MSTKMLTKMAPKTYSLLKGCSKNQPKWHHFPYSWLNCSPKCQPKWHHYYGRISPYIIWNTYSLLKRLPEKLAKVASLLWKNRVRQVPHPSKFKKVDVWIMKSSILNKREIRFFFLGFKVYITQSCIILHTLGSNVAKNVNQSWVILHILG